MTAKEALEIIFKKIDQEPVICATGYLCRTAQAVKHRPQNFYMIGSMGMAPSIGLGIALANPKQKVIILDGDGAVLMNMGTLASVGTFRPKSFLHIVLDNEGYESTGNQPSYTRTLSLEKIAQASGYPKTAKVTSPQALKKSLPQFLKSTGPGFLLIKVLPDKGKPAPRVEASPEEITQAFSESLK